MSYVTVTLNHFRAVQRWAAATGASVMLDATSFELEVKHRNRYFRFFPRFVALFDGRLSHVPTLVDEAIGFAGWLPYQPYVYGLSTDKLRFKECVAQAGLLTPPCWPSAQEAQADFIFKRSAGSFGAQVAGPFRVEAKASADPGPAAEGGGTLFAEQFVPGKIVKVWFWGARPFFAHVHDYPHVTGDGTSTLDELARAKAGVASDAWEASPQREAARACVVYQGSGLDDVVASGRHLWIEFRYGRNYGGRATAISDNGLNYLSEQSKHQVEAAGLVITRGLAEQFRAPVAYALDGMLDEQGNLWWLEMNSNPVFPPEGYARMFGDLFA